MATSRDDVTDGHDGPGSGSPPTSPAKRRGRARRVLRVVGLAIAALLLLLVLLAGGAWLYLQSDAGGERVRGLALDALRDSLAGELTIGRVDLDGMTLVLEDVALLTPDGERVAHIERATATLRLLPLFSKRVELEELKLTRPTLTLVSDARGLNLSRALGDGGPDEARADEGSGGGLAVRLEKLLLEGGHLSFESRGEAADVDGLEGGSRRFVLSPFEVRGEASYQPEGERIDGTLAAGGTLKAPVEGPLTLELEAHLAELSGGGTLRLEMPGGALDAQVRVEGLGHQRIELEWLSLEPGLLRAVAPSWPLSAPLSLEGGVDRRGSRVDIDLSGSAASARASLSAEVDLGGLVPSAGGRFVAGAADDRLTLERLALRVRHVDLSELLAGGPASNLGLDLQAAGSVASANPSVETLTGRLTLEVPEAALEGHRLGPATVVAEADRGDLELPSVGLALPGLSLEGSGALVDERLRASGRLSLVSLEELSGFVADATGQSMEGLSGKASARFEVAGPLEAPALTASVEGEALQLGSAAVGRLELAVDWPAAGDLLELKLDGSAEALKVGSLSWERVALSVDRSDRRLTLRGRAYGEVPLQLAASGLVDPHDTDRLTLDRLTLAWSERAWRLEAPSRLRLSPGFITVDGLALANGPQRLALSAKLTDTLAEGTLEVERLDLSQLPPQVPRPGGRLEGRVSLSVSGAARLGGEAVEPAVEGTLRLEGVAVDRFEDVEGRLSGALANGRVRAQGGLSSSLGSLELELEAPAALADAPASSALAATLVLRSLAMEELGELLGTSPASLGPGDPETLVESPGWEGRVTGSASLTGTVGTPRLAVTLYGDALVIPEHLPKGVGPLAFELTGGSGAGGQLFVAGHLEVGGGLMDLRLVTPWTLRGLLDAPPDRDALLTAPLELRAQGLELPLAALANRGDPGDSAPALTGRLGFEASFDGPALEPTGRLQVRAEALALGEGPPLDATVQLGLAPEAMTVALAVDEAASARKLVRGQGRIELAVATLLQAPPPEDGTTGGLDALASTPLSLELVLAPLSFERLRRWTPGSRDEAEAAMERLSAIDGGDDAELTGSLGGHVVLSGTLGAPELRADLGVTGLARGPRCLGEGALSLRYARGTSTLHLTSGDAQVGSMTLEGRLAADLSWPALAEREDWSEAPLHVTLDADDFDLSLLDGLVPQTRAIAGRLDANAEVSGPLGSPRIAGRLDLEDGRIATAGYGDLRSVRLALRGDRDAITLETLSAESGVGRFALTGEGLRDGDGWRLDLRAEADDFPLMTEDQLLATASLRASAKARILGATLDVAPLSVEEMHVRLPEVGGKELQELERPDDVVLLRNGRPIHGRKRRASPSAAKENEPGAVAGAGPGSPGGASTSPDEDAPPSGEKAGGAALADARGAPASSEPPGAAVDRPPGADRGFALRASLDAPRNLWIHGADVTMEIGLSRDFRMSYEDETRLYGTVQVFRGQVEALGRRFRVDDDSQVRFTGPPKSPALNVTAVHENEREEVTVFISVRGQGTDFALDVSSRPALPETEIYTLLATGRRTLKRGSGASMNTGDAASVVGALAASQLKRSLASNLPLDVLSIEAGDDGLTGARLQAGTYLTDTLYLGYEGQLGADTSRGENSHAVKLEYQMSPRWGLETEFGDARSGSLDLVWSRDF